MQTHVVSCMPRNMSWLHHASPNDATDEEIDAQRLSALSKVTKLRSSRDKTQTQVPLRAKALNNLPVLFPASVAHASEDRGDLSDRALKQQTLLSDTPSLAPQNTVAKDLSEAPCPVEVNGKRRLHISNASPEEKLPSHGPGCPCPPTLGGFNKLTSVAGSGALGMSPRPHSFGSRLSTWSTPPTSRQWHQHPPPGCWMWGCCPG